MSALKDKVDALESQIADKRESAKQAFAAFDAKRNELAAEGVDVTDETSEAFQEAHELHQAYGEAADEVETLTSARDKLWAMLAESNGDGGPAETRQAREQIKDGLHSRESYGSRIVALDAYSQLRDSGILNSRQRIGNIQLGEMMSRDELTQELSASVIVTDEGGDATVRPFIEPAHRGFVDPRFRPLVLLDLITVGQTDSDSVDYVVETGWTNNAAGVPEAQIDSAVPDSDPTNRAGVKPQSILSFEKKDEAVKTLAHWVAVTRKSLADVPRLRSIIDNRLRRGLADVLEDGIVEGDGEDENLLGILNTPGVQHQARTSGEPLVNDILRAMTKLRLAYFEPSAVGLNPLDFEAIRLQREDDDAGTGAYIYGPPSQVGPTTMWGVSTVQGPQFPEENPIVADWSVVELYIREGVMVFASDSHADFFTRNLVALLAELRAVSVIPQPEGICEVSEGSS